MGCCGEVVTVNASETPQVRLLAPDCPDYLPFKAVPGMSMHYLYALSQAIRLYPDQPHTAFEGDGIVYVGGGKYWPMVCIGVRMIRMMGCDLPIEVFYRGGCEPIDIEGLRGIKVDLIDLDKVVSSRLPRNNPGKGGWESKWESIQHSKFKRILFLDADAYCVRAPCKLFSILDNDAPPIAFWQDLDDLENSIKWHQVWPGGKNGTVAIQGGHLLIDRERAWKAIMTTRWMNEHSDHYYSRLYGDQDCLRVALAAGLSQYTNLGRANLRQGCFVCHHDSLPYIVHRCQSKLFVDNPPEKKRGILPLEDQVFDLFEEYVINR